MQSVAKRSRSSREKTPVVPWRKLPEKTSQQDVTRIETLAGVIMTTAPETLPRSEENSLSRGDVIQHRRFGTGKVLDSDGQNLVANFDKADTKKVRVTFVRRAS